VLRINWAKETFLHHLGYWVLGGGGGVLKKTLPQYLSSLFSFMAISVMIWRYKKFVVPVVFAIDIWSIHYFFFAF